ncbi:MAG: cytochrome c oxidase assembly protein [Comamonadaceae bacterium]|jgi:cytochrome c oxidase assembly protein subunit 11|nr:cytochrome c oxidase assembly protein [Comamonadaceae bacterium]
MKFLAALRRDNRQLLTKLAVIVALMFGFGYALVPLYRAICAALGINVLSLSERQTLLSQKGVAAGNGQIDYSREITVEFDTNARGPWDFKPAVRHMTVHPGELSQVMYEFRNKQDRTMAAQAIPSYAPMQASAHFNKLECFCFNEYTLKPGESKQWPVVFVIDPKLPKDVKTITLSYTFFEVAGKGGVKLGQAPKAVPGTGAAL